MTGSSPGGAAPEDAPVVGRQVEADHARQRRMEAEHVDPQVAAVREDVRVNLEIGD